MCKFHFEFSELPIIFIITFQDIQKSPPPIKIYTSVLCEPEWCTTLCTFSQLENVGFCLDRLIRIACQLTSIDASFILFHLYLFPSYSQSVSAPRPREWQEKNIQEIRLGHLIQKVSKVVQEYHMILNREMFVGKQDFFCITFGRQTSLLFDDKLSQTSGHLENVIPTCTTHLRIPGSVRLIRVTNPKNWIQ